MKSTTEENGSSSQFKDHTPSPSPGDFTLSSPNAIELLERFPFKEAQIIESKSKVKGYRGAWFRSVIRFIKVRNNEIWCAVQYIDFPDEKINYTKAYQQPTSGRRKRILMLRPAYPVLCMGLNDEAVNAAPGPVVVVNGDWLIGDLVDWFSDGCFWAAKITAVINKDFVQIELPSAPLGEGGRYQAAVKDIRPSLDWSEEHFWTLPNLMSCGGSKRKFLETEQVSSNSAQDPQAQDKEHFVILKQELGMLAFNNGSSFLTCHNSLYNEKNFGVSSFSIGNSSAPGTRKLKRYNKMNHRGNISRTENCTSTSGIPSSQEIQLQVDNLKQDSTDLASQTDGTNLRNQAGRLKDNVHLVQPSGQKDLPQPLSKIIANDVGISKVEPLGNLNETLEAFSFEDISTLVGEGNLLDLGDERISSSIMALEELVSKVIWLREVVQLGLKGWRKERKSRKWVVCESDANDSKNTE